MFQSNIKNLAWNRWLLAETTYLNGVLWTSLSLAGLGIPLWGGVLKAANLSLEILPLSLTQGGCHEPRQELIFGCLLATDSCC